MIIYSKENTDPINWKYMKRLVNGHSTLNTICPSITTDELLSTEVGQLKLVNMIINSVDPDVDPSNVCHTSIRTASKMGFSKVVELLLTDSRVDPTYFDNDALCKAAGEGHIDVVDVLLNDKRVFDSLDSEMLSFFSKRIERLNYTF